MEVIPQNKLAEFIETTITQVFKGVQGARNKGQPTYAVEEFTVEAVIVADDGLGALVAAQQIDETAPVINTEKRPEQVQKNTTKRRSTGKTDGTTAGKTEGSDTATDTSTDHEIGTALETATDDSTQSDLSQTDDTKQYGNELKIKSTVET